MSSNGLLGRKGCLEATFDLNSRLEMKIMIVKQADMEGCKSLHSTQKTTQKILAMLERNPSLSRREIAEELGGIS